MNRSRTRAVRGHPNSNGTLGPYTKVVRNLTILKGIRRRRNGDYTSRNYSNKSESSLQMSVLRSLTNFHPSHNTNYYNKVVLTDYGDERYNRCTTRNDTGNYFRILVEAEAYIFLDR